MDRDSDRDASLREPLTITQLFWGRSGLRAFWGLLLFWLLRELLMGMADPLLGAIFHPAGITLGRFEPRTLFAFEGAALFGVLGATIAMALIERRQISSYGVRTFRGIRWLLAGAFWGLASLSLLVFLLWMGGYLVFDGRLLSGGASLRDGFVWLAGFLIVGMVEELSFRGYLQFTLARGLRGIFGWLWKGDASSRRLNLVAFWIAAVVLSVGFGLGHRTNTGESPIGLSAAAVIGLVFCFSLWRTGSLWWAIGFHTTWDWGESFLYGVADSGTTVQGHLFATHPVGRPLLSGGLTGPEGSLLILPVIIVVIGIIWTTLPKQCVPFPGDQ